MTRIKNFYEELNPEDYIDIKMLERIKEKYKEDYFILTSKKKKNIDEKLFIKNYKNLDNYIIKHNENFVEKEIERTKNLLDNINGYPLDYNQRKVVVSDEVSTLVVAGAGSGKSLTMIGKIRYLIEEKKATEEEILCISFTKDATKNLKKNIEKNYNYQLEVYTFHKLALEILKSHNQELNIADSNLLENVIHNYFHQIVLNYPKMIYLITKYLEKKINKKNIIESYQNLLENNFSKINQLEKLISRFIHLMKSNNYESDYFYTLFKKNKGILFYKQKKRNRILLTIILNCYLLYQEELTTEKEIDFDDMISLASKIVEKKGIYKNYKYIIIDEYQDTSYLRFLLIKIIEKTNAKLITVGDDFQSIYRFTGCDLNIFLNFQKYFNKPNILKIENTYRNSQELIHVAGRFVMKNKNQIKKNLVSSKRIKKPVVIVYTDNIKKDFLKLIEKIVNMTNQPILILGRNNKDIYKVITKEDFKISEDGTILYKNNENIKLRYLTVHKSKGLEEENVIIINVEDSIIGFPSKLKDEKILKDVSSKEDRYPYSEERRLFYVALTRTKQKVYIIVSKKKESIFIKELLKESKKNIEIIKI